MAKSKIQLIKSNCDLCGKEIYSANQSLYGLTELKNKFGVKCRDCVPEIENRQLLDEMGEAIAKKLTLKSEKHFA